MIHIIAYKTCDRCGEYEVRTESSHSLSSILDAIIGPPSEKWATVVDKSSKKYIDVCFNCYKTHLGRIP